MMEIYEHTTLTCQILPSPAWVIFSEEHIDLSVAAGGSFSAGGVCSNTYSLNITEGRRLAELGGLKKPEVQG